MASATLLLDKAAPSEPESAAAAHSASAWWRRGHSYAFMALVAGQILFVRAICKVVAHGSEYLPRNTGEVLAGGICAIVVGQASLLGLWAALGGLATIPRWLIVGFIAVGSTFLFVHGMGTGNWTEFFEDFPFFTLFGLTLVYLVAVLLLPLRRLVGWRIDFDAAYHPTGEVRRGQLRLIDFAALSCAVGLPLALSRLITELDPESGTKTVIFLAIIAPLAGLICFPVAYAMLAPRRVWLWRGLAAVWILSLAYGLSLLAAIVPDFDLDRTAGSILGLKLGLAIQLSWMAGAVAGPLWVLRLCGLKLLRVA
jgi:hypothetical protein